MRKAYLEIRRKIPSDYRQNAAQLAAQHLSQTKLFQQSDHIACYLPYQNEFDATPIIKLIWQSRKTCYLPALNHDNGLDFVEYDAGDELANNKFSIEEPKNKSRQVIANKIELVVAPLVAFDAQGNRLGMGGGYYDRTFSFKLGEKNLSPFILGLGFSVQQAQGLPNESWDVLLDGVLTEDGLRLLAHR